MDSSDSESEEEVARSEKDQIIEKILKKKSSLISKKIKDELAPKSVLSEKDRTIEEILEKKSSEILDKKKKMFIRKRRKKIPNFLVKKRQQEIIKNAKKFKTTKLKFDEAMEILNAPGPGVFSYEADNCHPQNFEKIISRKVGFWQPLGTRKIWEQANICLQNQDWHNLTRILIHLCTERAKGCNQLDTIMQYVFLLVSHDPVGKKENFLNVFLETVCGCKSKQDKYLFLKRMFTIPKTKFTTIK